MHDSMTINENFVIIPILCRCNETQHSDLTEGRISFSLEKPVLILFRIFSRWPRLDLGVDPNKSTWVDLRTSSRVGSVLPGAVDSKSNLELKSDFTASRLEIDLN